MYILGYGHFTILKCSFFNKKTKWTICYDFEKKINSENVLKIRKPYCFIFSLSRTYQNVYTYIIGILFFIAEKKRDKNA